MFRRMSAVCMAALICICMTGCGESSVPYEPTANHTNPPVTSAQGGHYGSSEETETTAAETELDRRIQAIGNLKPVPVPADGWTDETLLPTVNIGGEPVKLPFCLSELLYGYEVTSEHADFYTAYADRVFSHNVDFVYSQCLFHHAFGDLVFPESTKPHDPALPDGIYDHELELAAQWTVVLEDESARYPVSVNCVTIGSPFEDVKQHIGFGEEDRAPGEDEHFPRFQVHCRTESLNILIMGEDTVDTILMSERNYEE